MNLINLFIFLGIAFFWGTGFLFIKILVEELPPIMSASLRVLTGLGFLFLYYSFKKQPLLPPKKSLPRVWMAGLFMFGFPFALIFWGEQFISAGITGILQGTNAIWTFVFGALFFSALEPFSQRKLIGVLLGILGLLQIYYPAIQFQGSTDELVGLAAVSVATICYGVSTNLNRQLFADHPELDVHSNLFQQLLSGGAFLLVLSLLTESAAWGSVHLFFRVESVLCILYLGIASTALAFLGLYHLIKKWGGVRAISSTYLVPLVALTVDTIYYQSLPSWNEVGGVVFILGGVILIQYRKGARTKASLPKGI